MYQCVEGTLRSGGGGGPPLEVMACSPLERMRGVSMDRGSMQRSVRRCLGGASQDLFHLQVSVKYRGPEIE